MSRIKRLLKPERSDVDEALLKWFKQQGSDNVPVSGPLVPISVTTILVYNGTIFRSL
jgi:hypothetical protein